MKVLLADDEPDILLLYRQMLEGNGYEVWEARNGVEVLRWVEEQEFDLVVLDLHMPRVNGFEALEKMREQGHNVPVVVMTGHYPDEVIEDRIDGLAVEEVLRKPVMITTLMNAVNRIVNKA